MAIERRRSRAGLVTLLLIVPVVLGAVFLGNWTWYVTRGSTPYDEVGIELNSRMPEEMRRWGCARIAERFPRTLPPHGCSRG